MGWWQTNSASHRWQSDQSHSGKTDLLCSEWRATKTTQLIVFREWVCRYLVMLEGWFTNLVLHYHSGTKHTGLQHKHNNIDWQKLQKKTATQIHFEIW